MKEEKVDEKFRTKMIRIAAFQWVCENCKKVNKIEFKPSIFVYCNNCKRTNYLDED